MLEEAKIDVYLSQPEVKIALDLLSLKHDFVVDELAKSILQEEISIAEVAEFLVAEFSFEAQAADELVDNLLLYVVEPFYVPVSEDELREEMEIEEDIEDDMDESSAGAKKQINWRDFIKPAKMQVAKAELVQATSSDPGAIVDYLWDSLGLERAEEAVVILSYLAGKGELANLWINDNRFKGILKKYLSFKYSAKEVDSLDWNKPTVGLLSLALQMTLQEKLALKEVEAAMIAIALVDNLPSKQKPQYITLAYVDARDGSFYWTDVDLVNNSLVTNL